MKQEIALIAFLSALLGAGAATGVSQWLAPNPAEKSRDHISQPADQSVQRNEDPSVHPLVQRDLRDLDTRIVQLANALQRLSARVDDLSQAEQMQVGALLEELQALARGDDRSAWPSFAGLIDALAKEQAAATFLNPDGSPRDNLLAAIDRVLADRERVKLAELQEVKRSRRTQFLERDHERLITRLESDLELSEQQASSAQAALNSYRQQMLRIEFEMEPLSGETQSEYYTRTREAYQNAAASYDAAIRALLTPDQLDTYEENARQLDLTAPGYGTPGR